MASVRQRYGPQDSLALAHNLGEHGIGLSRRADSPISPADPIELTFELPDGGELLRLRGRVVFESPEGGYHRLGVRFFGVSERARARIRRYVRGVGSSSTRSSRWMTSSMER